METTDNQKPMILRLYTQNNCQFCNVMIEKLANWGLSFDVVNISTNPTAKEYIRERGYKTVPQLFVDGFNINDGIDTRQFTESMFYDRLDAFIARHTEEELQEILERYDEPL